ncbi:CPBP family intramembrane metalloprotease [Enterococcus faecalis]|uniref:CPBP family intramembrane glutamic endopeptidase n=2 Tax=Enterococcus TaxID=1350 RepID=UPI0025AF80D7|nr:CPBP family intramembrane glutamic endopeptidase [Enterococcus faecalis]MDN3115232.1 CPBP family intramembrane metalloprotease [Enterococcus faecalis]
MKKSIFFKIIMVVVIYAIFLISNIVIEYIPIEDSSILKSVLQLGFNCILAWSSYLIVRTFKLTNDTLLTSRITSVWLTILGIIIILFLLIVTNVPQNIKDIFSGGLNLLVNSFLVAVAAAIFEEFLVRLLAFSTFLEIFKKNKYSLVFASIASSFLFGVLHISNLTMQSFEATMQQIFYATVLGICFSVIRIRFNGLQYVIFLHFLIDFQPTITDNGTPASSWEQVFLVFMPIAIVSIICLIQLNKDNKNLNYLF